MIYVSTSCISGKTIAEVIYKLAEYGIKNIELSGGTNYYDGIGKDLQILKDKYNLKYTCHAYFPPPKVPFVINLASCNDAIYKRSIEHYDKCIGLLKTIDCNILSIHAGFLVEIRRNEIGKKLKNIFVYDEAEAYSRFCYAYERLFKKCKEKDIKLYIENNVLSQENYKEFKYHNYFMMTDYKSIMYMKDQISFNLLLDLGHLHVSTNTLGIDFEQQCELLKRYVRWIHISENDGFSDQHKPLKEGGKILKVFEKIINSNINITLETIGETKEIQTSIRQIKKIQQGEEFK